MTKPTPPASLFSTLQVGSYVSSTDSFTLAFDCNDRTTTYLTELKLPEPEIADNRAFNIRTPGEALPQSQYKNRMVYASLWIKGGSTTALLATVRALRAAVATKPFRLRIALAGATQYSYATCLKVTADIPTDTHVINAKALNNINLVFECLPGLLGDLVVLDNLVCNAGLDGPASAGVTVFSDPLANVNAYTTKAGSAPTQTDKTYYSDQILAASPFRYYRLNEAAGTTAVDAMQSGNNGTLHGGVTLSTAGLLTGDSDTAMTFNGTTGYISCPTTGMPTGNSPWSMVAWIKTPAAFGAVMNIMSFGLAGTTRGEPQLLLSVGGSAIAGTFSGDTAGFALATSTVYQIGGTWDGTTLTLYVNGTARQTATPGALAIPTSGTFMTIGATAAASPTAFYNGIIKDATFISTCLSAATMTSLYATGNASPATNAASLVLAAGSRVGFGSAAWEWVNTWQMNWRWVSGLTATFYLHYTDANNSVRVDITSGTNGFKLTERVGGVDTLLAQATVTLTNEIQYVLQWSHFPGLTTGYADLFTVTLALNNNGSAATAFATLSAVSNSVEGALTGGLTGAPQLAAAGAALACTANTLSVFGPGAWTMVSTGTGTGAGAWDQTAANTYAGGPWQSTAAVRLDAPPAGTWNAVWRTGSPYFNGIVLAPAIPVHAPTDVLAFAVMVKASGVSNSCVQSVYFAEYDSGGNLLRTGSNAATLTGNHASYTLLSGTYTTGANCAMVVLSLAVTDGAGLSAGGAVWFDNVQVWDQTDLGVTSMPYCEMRFPAAPAQIQISGLVGDMVAPAALAFGLRPNDGGAGGGFLNPNNSLSLYAGRRSSVGFNAALIGGARDGRPAPGAEQSIIDATCWNGTQTQWKGTGINTDYQPFYVSGTVANLAGTYHLQARLRILDMASSTQKIQADNYLLKDPWLGAAITSDRLGLYQGPFLFPFTGTTWQVVDIGQIAIPAYGQSALGDPAQLYATIAAQATATSVEMDADWGALLPIDADYLTAMFYSPANSSMIVSGWLWLYFDGLSQSLGKPASPVVWSMETSPYPNETLAGGGAGSSTQTIPYVLATGDTVPHVDPRQSTSGAAGVNQWVVSAFDGATAAVPVAARVSYTPLYLNPR